MCVFVITLLALGNQLEMKTGGHHDLWGRSASRKDPGSLAVNALWWLCQPGDEAFSGPESPVPWVPGAQCLQARHCRQDTSHTWPAAPMRHLSPPNQLSRQPPPCRLPGGLCSLPVLLVDPVQSPPFL